MEEGEEEEELDEEGRDEEVSDHLRSWIRAGHRPS